MNAIESMQNEELKERIETMRQKLQAENDEMITQLSDIIFAHPENLLFVEELLEQLEKLLIEKQNKIYIKNTLINFAQVNELPLPDTVKKYDTAPELRDIEHVAPNYQIYFTHGISPYGAPNGNSLLEKNVDWKTKLKIVFALNPTIPVSTTKEGEKNKTWHPFGVILSKGKIDAVYKGDGGTQARGLRTRTRSLDEICYHKELTATSIHDALSRGDAAFAKVAKTRQSYNEFIISHPRIAGIFIEDTPDKNQPENIPNHDEIYEIAQELGIPVFFLKDGETHCAHYNDEKKQYQLQEETIPPEKIIRMEQKLTEDQRKKIIREIEENNPFRIDSLELVGMTNRDKGRQIFVELNMLEQINKGEFINQCTEEITDPEILKNLERFDDDGRKIQIINVRQNPQSKIKKSGEEMGYIS